MTPKIVELNVGKTLEDISAGVLIIEEMKEQEERYEKDLNKRGGGRTTESRGGLKSVGSWKRR